MSLRDQLLAKGVVSKKRARQLDREAKKDRKADQGSRDKQRALEREARARAQAAAEAERARRLAERKEREALREAAERDLQIRNLIAGNRLRPGRGQRFWHRSADGTRLVETQVSSGMAFQLRCGEVALAVLHHGTFTEIVPIPARAADKLFALAPDRIVFWVRDPTGLSDPALGFHQPDPDPSLRARRATEADLARFRAAARRR